MHANNVRILYSRAPGDGEAYTKIYASLSDASDLPVTLSGCDRKYVW